MASDPVSDMANRRDSAFAGLVCASLGLLLVTSANLFAEVSMTTQCASLILGTSIVSLLVSAFTRHSADLSTKDASVVPPQSAQSTSARVAACTLIASTAYAVLSVFLDGLATPLCLFAGGLVVTPWRKIARSRAQYMACWAAVIVGVTAAIFFHGRVALPFFLTGFGFYLWLIALACWIVASFHKYAGSEVSGKPRA